MEEDRRRYWLAKELWRANEVAMLLLGEDDLIGNPLSLLDDPEIETMADFAKTIEEADWRQKVAIGDLQSVWDALAMAEMAGSLKPIKHDPAGKPSRFDSGDWYRPAEVIAWAKPHQWPRFPFGPSDLEAGNGGVHVQPNEWPWGTYETKLLGDLAAAVKEHWSNYDPANPRTAPKSEVVRDWLISERGVSDRVAEVMAQILRADGLRPGPKK